MYINCCVDINLHQPDEEPLMDIQSHAPFPASILFTHLLLLTPMEPILYRAVFILKALVILTWLPADPSGFSIFFSFHLLHTCTHSRSIISLISHVWLLLPPSNYHLCFLCCLLSLFFSRLEKSSLKQSHTLKTWWGQGIYSSFSDKLLQFPLFWLNVRLTSLGILTCRGYTGLYMSLTCYLNVWCTF